MNNFYKSALVVCVAAVSVLASCNRKDRPDLDAARPLEPTITDALQRDTSYSLLVEALRRGNVLNTLDNLPQYTFFAPTNVAMRRRLDPQRTIFANSSREYDSLVLQRINSTNMNELLRYHTLTGTINLSAPTGFYSTLLPSDFNANTYITLYLQQVNSNGQQGVRIDNRADVFNQPTSWRNGNIFRIDTVLDPMTLGAAVQAIPSLSTSANRMLDPAVRYIDTLRRRRGRDFWRTVFVPNNEAWTNNGGGTSADWNTWFRYGTLTKNAYLSGLAPAWYDTESLMPGAGSNYLSAYVSTVDNRVRFNNINTVLSNGVFRNGVLHIVDNITRVPSVADAIGFLPELSTLASVVSPANAAASNGLPSQTVFAPVNNAFAGVNIPTNDVDFVVKSHIVPFNLFGADPTPGAYANLSSGPSGVNNTTIVNNGGVTFVQANSVTDARIISKDFKTSNGVIKYIDKVLR